MLVAIGTYSGHKPYAKDRSTEPMPEKPSATSVLGTQSHSAIPPLSAKAALAGLSAWERVTLALFTGIFLYLAVFATFHRNINWDEFHFLAQVYQYDQGRLTQPLQTFHVHLFRWLTWLPVSDASQVVAGRVVMLLLELGSICALYCIALRMFCVRTAILVVVGYLTSGFVIEHGTSFRTDPVVVFALMTSLAILITCRLTKAMLVLASLLAAIGLLVSIKGALYLPAFAGAFIWRAHEEGLKPSLSKFAISGALVVAFYALLWWLHVASLEVAEALSVSRNNASVAAGKTALFQGLWPREYHIGLWKRDSFLFAAAIGLGAAFCLIDLVRGQRVRAVTVLLFALPIVSLVFYRNAYPYFFPFIMAPVALVAGPVFERIARPLAFIAFIAAGLFVLVDEAPRYLGKDQEAQRALIEAAQTAFPEPVPYIDRAGMVPSYPKAGYFMTSWGIETALASGNDVIANTIRSKQPQFVIANAPSLVYALEGPTAPAPKPRLTEADETSLRNNYVPHWGALWVAGKKLNAGSAPETFDLVIGGRYTLECDDRVVTIDGEETPCGQSIDLGVGKHTIAADKSGEVTLRIGDNLYRPEAEPPEGLIFHRL